MLTWYLEIAFGQKLMCLSIPEGSNNKEDKVYMVLVTKEGTKYKQELIIVEWRVSNVL